MLNIINEYLNFRQRSHPINTKHNQTSAHLRSLTISMDEQLRWTIKYVLREQVGIKFQIKLVIDFIAKSKGFQLTLNKNVLLFILVYSVV